MEQTSPRIDRLYTEDEYLRMEAASDVKHEFHNGRVIAMAGGGYDHSLIKSNLGGESRASLKGRGYEVVDSDTRVRRRADPEATTTRTCPSSAAGRSLTRPTGGSRCSTRR